jgi:copper chaperone CopZ
MSQPQNSTEARYAVQGMTCSHCVHAVTAEISRIPGVRDVTVSLADGSVTVASDRPLEDAAVAAAVDEAGYRVA